MDPDIILCDIITTELSLSPERVVVYNQNYVAPSDDNAYVTVSKGTTRIISSTNEYDPNTDEQVQSVVLNETYNIEISSKSREALELLPNVIMALRSVYSEQQQEEENIRIFRNREYIDLSLIEGASALHRYRIPVIVDSVKMKRSSITPFDKFQTPEEVLNG